MSLREKLGPAQDANLFENAPCTDLTNLLWDPKKDWETSTEARIRQALAAQICRDRCPVVDACQDRRDRLRAEGLGTAGVWAGDGPKLHRRSPTKAECGTKAGYRRHTRNGEKACFPCRIAYSTYMREYMAERRRP